MAETEVHMPGTIGGSNKGLAELILSTELEIYQLGMELRGYKREIAADGSLTFVPLKLTDDEKAQIIQKEECITWFQGKLRGPLSKNTYLSNMRGTEEMSATVWSMNKLFLFELMTRWREFKLNEKKFLQLAEIYLNVSDFAVRFPMDEGIRKMLTTSVSEQKTTIDQKIKEESAKRGILGLGWPGSRPQG